MAKRLIFLHGGPFFKDYMQEQFLASFPSSSCTFYTQKEPATVEEPVNELSSKILSASDKPILIGHSWGGILALEYCRHFGDSRISGLVLMSTPVFFGSLSVKEVADPMTLFMTTKELEVGRDYLEKIFASANMAAIGVFFKNYLVNLDLSKTLSELQVPSLVVFGDQDARVLAEVQMSYKKINPHSQMAIIKGAGHFPFILDEHKKDLVNSISKFVDSIPLRFFSDVQPSGIKE